MANTVAINMLAQVNEESKRHVLFDQILYNQLDRTNIQQQDNSIKSKNPEHMRKHTNLG